MFFVTGCPLLYSPITRFISSLLWMKLLPSNKENQNGAMPLEEGRDMCMLLRKISAVCS
jgi:hypothetical protein